MERLAPHWVCPPDLPDTLPTAPHSLLENPSDRLGKMRGSTQHICNEARGRTQIFHSHI